MTWSLWLVLVPTLAVSAVPTRARQAIAAGNFDRALKLLDAEVARRPGDVQLAELQLQRAACFSALGQHDRAETAAVAALQRQADVAWDSEQGSPALLELLEAARKKVLASALISADRVATVRVDGREWGPAPVTLELPVGNHQVEVVAADGVVAARDVLLEFGRKADVALTLPMPPPPLEPHAETRPSAVADAPVPPAPSEPQLPRPSLPEPRVEREQGSRALPAALLVSGLLIAAAGGGAFGWAQTWRSTLEAGLATRQQATTVVAVNAASVAALVAGGALLVTSIVLFAATGRELPLAVMLRPGGALALDGRW